MKAKKIEQTDLTEPLIYVGTYRKYNSGSLFGKWIDPLEFSDKAEFIEACRILHSDESDPELMFQDFQCIPKMFISESWIDPNYWVFIDWITDNRNSDLIAYYADFIEESYNYNKPLDESDFIDWLEDETPYLYSGVDKYDITHGFIKMKGASEQTADNLVSYIDFDSVIRNLEHYGYTFWQDPNDWDKVITDYPFETF